MSSSDLPPNDGSRPDDNRISRIIKMDTPEYGASLTDPMSEVDDHFTSLKDIAERYGLAYFLMVSHPLRDGTVKHQVRCDVVPPATAAQFYQGLSIELAAISAGQKRIVDVIDELSDGMEDDDGGWPDEEDPT